MDEYKLISKISKIKKGSRVAVIPHTGQNGLSDNAIGYNCSHPEGYSVELKGPFEAFLEEFDGDIVKVSTATYPCLKISVQDLEDIVDITRLEEMSQEPDQEDPHI